MYGIGIGIFSAISFVTNWIWFVQTERRIKSFKQDLDDLRNQINEIRKDQDLCQNYIILESDS